jgi:hypothetical protein
MQTEKFLGLTKKQAQDKAEGNNLIFRLIKIDGRDFFSYPEDTRDDRICIEVENGVVTKATIQ